MERVIYGKVISEKGGTGVGWRSASGANNLNFWRERRERESAIALWWPGTWAAWRMKLCVTENQTKRLRSDMMANEAERPLLMMWTVV